MLKADDKNPAVKAQSIQGLQGMGKKSIAPRAEPCDDIEAVPLDLDKAKIKRDLAGFDRALKFSEAALTKGPKVQLGTGAEGSGVGIIVDNNASTRKCLPSAHCYESRSSSPSC